MKKLKKEYCEVCDTKDVSTLHLHHLVERTEIGTSNHPLNLAILCANCHARVHANEIELVGLYPSTKPPNGRSLIFKEGDKQNFDIGVTRVYVAPSWKIHHAIKPR